MNISYKPQMIAPKFEGTVRELFYEKIGGNWETATFISQVTKPLKLDNIIENQVQKLSGGELQRVAIILALAKGADTYLIDEPSAYLDSEQRVICARVLKRFILNNQKTAFVVEHDFIMATYLADQVIVYEGEPGVKSMQLECIFAESMGGQLIHIFGALLHADTAAYTEHFRNIDDGGCGHNINTYFLGLVDRTSLLALLLATLGLALLWVDDSDPMLVLHPC